MEIKPLITSSGINNKISEDNTYSGTNAPLLSANNVLIDRGGKIVSDRGSSLIFAGDFHSLFFLRPGSFYAVEKRAEDSALYKIVISEDGSAEKYGIISGMPRNSKFDYVSAGVNTYYCNGIQNGVISNDVSNPWPDQVWTGTESDIDMIKPPVGTHIDMLSGRILLSSGDELFYSEHGLVGLVDELKNRVRFYSDIIMVCSVQDGAFISDNENVYFVSGKDPNQWECRVVLNYPAVEWCRVYGFVNPSDFGIESMAMSVMFGTVNGACVGLPDGTVINMTEDVLTMPYCGKRSGSIMVVDDTTILQSGV